MRVSTKSPGAAMRDRERKAGRTIGQLQKSAGGSGASCCERVPSVRGIPGRLDKWSREARTFLRGMSHVYPPAVVPRHHGGLRLLSAGRREDRQRGAPWFCVLRPAGAR